MLTSILLSLVMQSPTQDALSAWKDVPQRGRVQIGMPYLKPIHPRDLEHLPGAFVCGNRMLNLDSLCCTSHIIAIGTFDGVLRYGHSPLFSSSNHQEILYAFRVEKYLKGNCGPWLKIRQSGGPLPWKIAEGLEGCGFRVIENPIPIIGSRYMVFLRDPKIEFPAFSNVEFMSEKRGDSSNIFCFTDEMRFSDLFWGKILIKNGVTLPIEEKWGLSLRPQIIGRTEAEAVRLISAYVAVEEERKRREGQ
jgi:hypothetical protein